MVLGITHAAIILPPLAWFLALLHGGPSLVFVFAK